MEFAFGYLDLTPDVFWSMTRREFSNKLKGFSGKMEHEERRADERARAIAYTVYAMTPKAKGKSNMSIDSFWPIKKQTEEDKRKIKEQRKKAKEMFPKKICLPEFK